MKLWRMAGRNVWRKPMRTAVTCTAMAVSAGVMVLFGAIMEGYVVQMKRSALSMETAEAQVHAASWAQEPTIHAKMEDSAKIVAALRAQGIAAVERLYAFGLVARGEGSASAMMRGIDLVHERQVTRLHTAVATGHWLDAQDPHGVVLGKKLARRLGAKPGDELVVLSQAADGSMADDLLTVRGVLKAVGERTDRAGLFMVAATFRELMVFPAGAHEIAVMRPGGPYDDVQSLGAALRAVAPKHDVKTWPKLLPALAEMLAATDAGVMIMLMIAYLAVVTVVLNATLMSVFERIREFGIMKAVGTTPRQVFSLVLVEAVVQALFAAAIALVLGGGGTAWLQHTGIDLSGWVGDFSFNGMTIPPMLEPTLTASALLQPIVVLVIMVVLAAVYPGVKAARLEPVAAIRHR